MSEDLKLINQYTRRELTEDEVFIFNVTLCDNEIDRDYECFTVDALNSLAELFLGKTGIFDHNPKGENQTARIYSAQVLRDDLKQNQMGEPYHYLQAKAYMVKSQKNSDMILDIDGGIKKEVSVGCSVATASCSICGTNTKDGFCEHKKGNSYNDKLCYVILDDPTDAYEWSFVAVPAQKNAGVTKGFDFFGEGYVATNRSYDELMKAFTSSEENMVLSKSEVNKLCEKINSLQGDAELGKAYLGDLRRGIVKMAFLCGEVVDNAVFAGVVEKLSLNELLAYKKAYEIVLDKKESYGGQLKPAEEKAKAFSNNQFKI